MSNAQLLETQPIDRPRRKSPSLVGMIDALRGERTKALDVSRAPAARARMPHGRDRRKARQASTEVATLAEERELGPQPRRPDDRADSTSSTSEAGAMTCPNASCTSTFTDQHYSLKSDLDRNT
jgi:hypothetical protein